MLHASIDHYSLQWVHGVVQESRVLNVVLENNNFCVFNKYFIILQILSYHASANQDEVSKIERVEIPTAQQLKILNYEFADMSLSNDETILATLRMFIDLDLINKFK